MNDPIDEAYNLSQEDDNRMYLIKKKLKSYPNEDFSEIDLIKFGPVPTKVKRSFKSEFNKKDFNFYGFADEYYNFVKEQDRFEKEKTTMKSADKLDVAMDMIKEYDTYVKTDKSDDKKNIKGFIILEKNSKTNGKTVVALYVSPKYRRQGEGPNLLKFSEDVTVKSKGNKVLTIEVCKSNSAAINLYKQFGFVEDK
ncbi:MAG: GNAT family N-acetyltransferase [Anaeroplasmataceae bacterium]